MNNLVRLAEAAYNAYCGTVDWKFQDGSGRTLPNWQDVDEVVRTGWIAAAGAILEILR